MKKYAVIILIALLFIVSVPLCLSAEEGSSHLAVATVNGVVITKTEHTMQTNRLLPSASYHGSVSPEKKRETEKEALEILIDDELYFQEAKRQGLQADTEAIQAKLDAVRGQFATEEAFREALKKNLMTPEVLHQRIVKILLIEKLLQQEVTYSLTDEELSDYYHRNREKFIIPESIRLRYIWVKYRPTEADFMATAKKKADEALRKIKAGDDMAEVAWNYSDDKSRVKGGDIGFIHRGRMPEQVEEAAFSLKEGELSDIIQNDFGYHILRMEGRQDARQVPYEEIKEGLRKDLISSTERKRKSALKERLRAGAQIEYLLKTD